jgi:hypothetical protein
VELLGGRQRDSGERVAVIADPPHAAGVSGPHLAGAVLGRRAVREHEAGRGLAGRQGHRDVGQVGDVLGFAGGQVAPLHPGGQAFRDDDERAPFARHGDGERRAERVVPARADQRRLTAAEVDGPGRRAGLVRRLVPGRERQPARVGRPHEPGRVGGVAQPYGLAAVGRAGEHAAQRGVVVPRRRPRAERELLAVRRPGHPGRVDIAGVDPRDLAGRDVDDPEPVEGLPLAVDGRVVALLRAPLVLVVGLVPGEERDPGAVR